MTLATTFNYFANSLWQVPLLAFCCWCALRLMRASARVQYAVWIVTLLLCVALPWRGANPRVDAVVATTVTDASFTGELLHPLPPAPLPFYALRIRPQTRDLLAELYLLLTAIFLLRLFASHLALRRLVRASAKHVPSPAERLLLAEHGDTLRVLPPGHNTPMVAGVLRPVLLLPKALLTGDPEALRAVLAHELAHLRRRDTLVNLLLRALALPVAYHPATALIHRRIQHARELLCDAVAARELSSPEAYAHVLLTLARQLIRTGGTTPHSTVGFFERNSTVLLEERIMTLITPPAPLRTASRLLRFTAGAAVFGAAIAAASLVHLTPSVQAAAQEPATVTAPAATPVQPSSPGAPTSPQAAAKPHSKRVPSTPASQPDAQAIAPDFAAAAAALRDPEFQRQLAQAQVDTAQLRKSMEQLRTHLNSPEFKQQIAQASAEAAKAVKESAGYRKQMEDLRKQLDSPEFRKQIQQATEAAGKVKPMPPAELAKLIAESRELALLTSSSALHGVAIQQDASPQRVPAGIMAGSMVSRVEPVYPDIARAAHVSGAVVLRAVIGKDGTVRNLQYLSGPEMLKGSAIDAVRYWIYKPYLLNGEPTEVETTVTVTYSLPE